MSNRANKSNPILSIGMIFKNEIRCLERCMESLAPLREAVSCELVMADTGSDDGSREIAAKYADILFDFPWINDFAAARNAVMDRCSGKWYLSIDADEWLDGDIAELTAVLRQGAKAAACAYRLRIRNYVEYIVNDEYTESHGLRLLWMDTGLRFRGSIHEIWPVKDPPLLGRTLLHHDGYAGSDSEAGRAKRRRNMELLRRELAKEPESLKLLLQCVESSRGLPECMGYIRRAAALVDMERPGWQVFGPPVFRYAVLECDERELPGLDDWIARSEEKFPRSFFTRLDVNYTAFRRCWKEERFAECVRRGRAYLDAAEDLREGRGDQSARTYSTVIMSAPRWAVHVKILMAGACIRENDPEQAWELLADMDGRKLNEHQAGSAALFLRQIHTRTNLDTRGFLLRFYEQICAPEPGARQAEARKTAFMKEAASIFPIEYREYEKTLDYILRPAYTLFLPLAGVCEIGTAAAVLDTDSRDELKRLLGGVKDWDELPPAALEHALRHGAPPPPMPLEKMDALAGRMARAGGGIAGLAVRAGTDDLPDDLTALVWRRAVVLAAVRANRRDDAEQGIELYRAFAKVMAVFLPRYYTPEMLCEKNIVFLAPLFRFGWYCARAFDALDSGDAAGYVRLLREGLIVSPDQKPAVEFLLKHTPELQKPKPSGELLALAEKVRMMLSAYPPDDPAVVAIKASPVYQKVAHLIEGPEVGLFGGLAQ